MRQAEDAVASRDMSGAARASAERFRVEEMGARLAQLYEALNQENA
jgi:hypothetical protein